MKGKERNANTPLALCIAFFLKAAPLAQNLLFSALGSIRELQALRDAHGPDLLYIEILINEMKRDAEATLACISNSS